MIIREAKNIDKDITLKILDEFNDYVNLLKEGREGEPSTIARDGSSFLFDEMLKHNKSKIFIALDKDIAIGFLEIHKVPRFRRAKYYGEIEGMFVKEEFRGKGVAQSLMKAAFEWARDEKLDCIRLYSGFELERAHAFYKKMGFDEAGKTFKNYSMTV